jgi:hypothetical protein
MPMMQLMAFSEISAKVERPPEAAGQLRSETVERQRGQVVLIRDDDFLMLQIQLTGNLQIIRPTRSSADTAVVPDARLRIVF